MPAEESTCAVERGAATTSERLQLAAARMKVKSDILDVASIVLSCLQRKGYKREEINAKPERRPDGDVGEKEREFEKEEATSRAGS